MRLQSRTAVISLVLGLSCGSQDGTTDPPPPPGGPLTFESGVQPIFTANCAFSQCHAGDDPEQGMNLAAGQAYSNVVNVPSVQVPRLLRIDPNRPDSSYLVIKLEGRAGAVGGVPTQMPLGGMLTSAQIDTIRAWVSGGAPNN